ncbi:uncharacterized protein FIBRA_09172 [Fibroporia radiculosa]|uniref:Cytochrome P450 n=1 Tax=Fibroporia radiculosa TaxID=599839 RepID=J4ICR4_9APHY|nr:uncharacterized protein FIBRA_09172 [Fibroporia radiculosa]CCM06866.1 predicted protein [Fibroporia radiculosa]
MSVLMTAIVVMVMHPVVQARAQAELDTVVGKTRLPTFDDMERLPYLQCVMSEIFRWGVATPVGTYPSRWPRYLLAYSRPAGVPHRSIEDDEYNGWHIPKGTMVIANAWAMLRDERVYPDPDRFNPDRFLSGEGHEPQADPRGPLFGFGRRVCPGKDLAENSLFAALALVLHAFKLTPAVGADGCAVRVDGAFREHSIRHPEPFTCTILPRLKTSAALIRQVMESH